MNGSTSAIRKECMSDNECILFKDECGNLSSFYKNTLPRDTETHTYENVFFYKWKNDSPTSCLSNYLTESQWPKNPVAKYIKNICTVVSEPPTNNRNKSRSIKFKK